jgi:hypothetical protein
MSGLRLLPDTDNIRGFVLQTSDVCVFYSCAVRACKGRRGFTQLVWVTRVCSESNGAETLGSRLEVRGIGSDHGRN